MKATQTMNQQPDFDNPQIPISFALHINGVADERIRFEWAGPNGNPPLRYQGVDYQQAEKVNGSWLVRRNLPYGIEEICIVPAQFGVFASVFENTINDPDHWTLVDAIGFTHYV